MPAQGKRENLTPAAKPGRKGQAHAPDKLLQPSDPLQIGFISGIRQGLNKGGDHVLAQEVRNLCIVPGPVLAQVHPVACKKLIPSVPGQGDRNVMTRFPRNNVGGDGRRIGKGFVEGFKHLGEDVEDLPVPELEFVVLGLVEARRLFCISGFVKRGQIFVPDGKGLDGLA